MSTESTTSKPDTNNPNFAPNREEDLRDAWEVYSALEAHLEQWVIGRGEGPDGDGRTILDGSRKALGSIRLMLAALFSEGHLLLEDYPGTGKSYMSDILQKCLKDDVDESGNRDDGINIAMSKRIQCVPDLLPSDITGYDALVNNVTQFKAGPVFAYLVLMDEINRTTPKTQSAMLEAMAEKKVTVGNSEHKLGDLFFVVGTQNPMDQVGTFPLTEAQLDRFIFKRRLQSVSPEAVERIIKLAKYEPLPEEQKVPVNRLIKAIQTVKNHVSPIAGTNDPKWDQILPFLNQIREIIKSKEVKDSDGDNLPEDALKEGSTPSPRSLQKLVGALKAIAFIQSAQSRKIEDAVVDPISMVPLIARDYFVHRIYPVKEELSEDEKGALIDEIIKKAIHEFTAPDREKVATEQISTK